MKNDKRHILFITPGFPKDNLDTRCIPAMHLFLTELAKTASVNVSVIALDYPYKTKVYDWKNLRINAIGGNNKGGLLKLRTYRKAIKTALKVHQGNKVSHIHSFWLGDAAIVGNQLKKRLNLPHTCTLMGQDVLRENIYFKLFKSLPELIALSDFHNNTLKKNFNIKPKAIIPWGIEELEEGEEERPLDFIGVGNLTKLKAFEKLISAVSKLKVEKPNVKAIIVGEGPEEKRLKQKIEKLELQDNIELVGVLNREQTLDKMRQSKSLIHCSSFESFGLVIIEALALGLHVFSTPVGIAEEIKEVTTYHSESELIGLIKETTAIWGTGKVSYPFRVENTVNRYLKEVF